MPKRRWRASPFECDTQSASARLDFSSAQLSLCCVDKLERSQIRLILEHLCSETLRKTGQTQKALYAKHSARGVLGSGATVKRTIENIETMAGELVEQAVDQVAAVAQDTDAFTVIVSNVTAIFRGFEPHVTEAVRLATRGGGSGFESVKSAGDNLFVEMRTRIFKQLEIHRFSFTKPSAGDLAALRVRPVEAIPPPAIITPKRNPGGKPLAEHWDKMWAAIAVTLWTGALRPKSQADVKAAMFDWFNKAELEVGDTALTQRARQLWQAMQDADG